MFAVVAFVIFFYLVVNLETENQITATTTKISKIKCYIFSFAIFWNIGFHQKSLVHTDSESRGGPLSVMDGHRIYRKSGV